MTGSRLRYSLDAAIGRPQDWSFSWMLMDDVTFGSTCGFCGQSRQRIRYEIMRDAERLWICQRCAGRYCLGGMRDGSALDQATIRGQLHGLTARLKQRTCQDIVHKVSAGAEDQALLEVALYFDRNLQLSPLHAARLFWLSQHWRNQSIGASSRCRRGARRTSMNSGNSITPLGPWSGRLLHHNRSAA